MRWPWSKPKTSAQPALSFFSDLKIADYAAHPVWQDADNSDVIGDGDAMIFAGMPPIDLEEFAGRIACCFETANGTTMQGFIEASRFADPNDIWSFAHVIIVSTPSHMSVQLERAVMDDFCRDGTEKHFTLQVPCPDDVMHATESQASRQKLIHEIREFTGLTVHDLFPMTCKPRVPIKALPESWSLDGFLSQNHNGENIFVR